MPVSSQDAFDIADKLLDASIAIMKFRNDQWDSLNPLKREALKNQAHTLSIVSDQMLNKAIALVIDETSASVSNLKSATDKATRALKTLNDIKKALAIASALSVADFR